MSMKQLSLFNFCVSAAAVKRANTASISRLNKARYYKSPSRYLKNPIRCSGNSVILHGFTTDGPLLC